MKVPFTLDGPNGVLRHLEHLIETKGFALVCVAEGAGQVRSCCIMLPLAPILLSFMLLLLWLLVYSIEIQFSKTLFYMLGFTNCSRSNVLMHFQEYFQKSNATDASGNTVLSDIGVHLQQKVSLFFFIFGHCNGHEALGGMALPVLDLRLMNHS